MYVTVPVPTNCNYLQLSNISCQTYSAAYVVDHHKLELELQPRVPVPVLVQDGVVVDMLDMPPEPDNFARTGTDNFARIGTDTNKTAEDNFPADFENKTKSVDKKHHCNSRPHPLKYWHPS
ncbi:hypothetical protein HanIR_Chr14g0710841 [Helianthus annuus]|nr:hypothetical protein HanIR_Chr14g0710841 [Helianthus annuus]